MKGDEVIEDGVVVVEGNRITRRRPRAEVAIPAGAQDDRRRGQDRSSPASSTRTGTAAMGSDQIIPQQNWVNYASLAFGVTTMHDPSQRHGRDLLGGGDAARRRDPAPRIFSTGTILYGAAGDFKAEIDIARRRASPPAAHEGGRRDHRQELQPAAPRAAPADHRGRARDRHDGGARGRIALRAQHDDGGRRPHGRRARGPRRRTSTRTSWRCGRRRKVGYTPTLIVGYGGTGGENYWYQKTNVWEDPRLSKFVPRVRARPAPPPPHDGRPRTSSTTSTSRRSRRSC